MTRWNAGARARRCIAGSFVVFAALWVAAAVATVEVASASESGAERAVETARPDLAGLMAHLAASRGVEARFREVKELPLLREPLRSEGVLYFAPPDRMARFTEQPERASLLLAGNRLRIEDSLGVQEIDLASQAAARDFIDQLLTFLRGDLAALERDYRVDFDWRDGPWSLRLAPKGFRMRQVISEIELSGVAQELKQMVVRGAAGEVTRTTYTRVEADRPFDVAERARLFPDVGSPRALGP